MSCVYSFDLIRIFDMQTTPNLVMLLKFVIFLSVGNPKSESNFFYPVKLELVFQS